MGSLLEWKIKFPEHALVARVAFYAAAVSLERRHGSDERTPLDTLLRCGDKRTSSSDIRDCAVEVMDYARRGPCCAGELVWETMRYVEAPSDVLSRGFQAILSGLSLSIRYLFSVADCERNNKRHCRRLK